MKFYDLDEAPAGHINVLKELRLGAARQSIEHVEKDPAGVIRGGSVGAILPSGIIGECHRKSHLRFKGFGGMIEENVEPMTTSGALLEDDIIQKFEKAGHVVAKQNELSIPLRVKTADGGELEGIISPDCILLDPTDRLPIYFVELKNVSGITGAEKRHIKLQPDPKHMIQAANQAIRLGDYAGRSKPLPGALMYTSRVDWHVFAAPKYLAAVVDKANIDVARKGDGGPLKITPFFRVYYLDWTRDGKLTYWTSGMEHAFITEVDRESIDRYYRAVGKEMEAKQHLGPRPAPVDLAGNSTYFACDYCDLKPTCDAYEKQYDVWMDHAKTKVLEERKERWAIKERLETETIHGAAASEAAEAESQQVQVTNPKTAESTSASKKTAASKKAGVARTSKPK